MFTSTRSSIKHKKCHNRVQTKNSNSSKEKHKAHKAKQTSKLGDYSQT